MSAESELYEKTGKHMEFDWTKTNKKANQPTQITGIMISNDTDNSNS